jgi:hypothetical protein
MPFAELTLLHAWSIAQIYAGQNNKTTRAMDAAFTSIFTAYNQICSEFLRVNVLPYADKLHAVSVAVRSSHSLAVNLKLFDLLGRLGIDGLWASWGAQRCPAEQPAAREALLGEAQTLAESIKALINNNPALLLPSKDAQAIDLSIALSLLIIDGSNRDFILSWLGELLARAKFSYEAHSKYPSVLRTYTELLEHPKSRDEEYRKNATSASILYPVVALWAALLEDEQLYSEVAQLQKLMEHCTYQFWYPDERSEEHFYKNSEVHGAALANLALDGSAQDFLAQVFRECEETKHFEELSAVKYGWWPIVLVACRHYRLPLPLHLLEGLRKSAATSPANTTGNATDGNAT